MIDDLKKYQQNELKKKAEEEKESFGKFCQKII
jgi:hypothetical protein